MYSYLNNLSTQQTLNIKKKNKLDYFYWKYIYGDLIVSKFISFLIKSGYKNRSIRLFFKALQNLKVKFGINPILLVKYIILKRNVLHKVTKKKVKQKTFYYLRLLDFDRQISNTIKKIIELIFFLKEKKKLKLWQSIFTVLLNFCLSKSKKKKNVSMKYNKSFFLKKIKKVLATSSLARLHNQIKKNFLSIYKKFKFTLFYLSNICVFFYKAKKYFLNFALTNKLSIEMNKNILFFLLFYKRLFYYLTKFKYRFAFFKHRYMVFFRANKKKIKLFLNLFRRLKKKYSFNKLRLFNKRKYKKRILSRNKSLLRLKHRQHFLTRFFFKDLSELKKASKFKNSFLNFKLRNKKRRELEMGTRIHSKHDIRLRHRKIFFRISKHGQVKN